MTSKIINLFIDIYISMSENIHSPAIANAYNKNLAISFAYPADVTKQKTDRYVMSIDDIKDSCSKEFGATNVEIATLNYSHSNNRNKAPKKVIEYLILCNGR